MTFVANVYLKQNVLKESNLNKTDIYLAKIGYKAEYTTQKVLKKVIQPINFADVDIYELEKVLHNSILSEVPNLIKICNIQQLQVQRSNSPYTYVVVYYDDINGTRQYLRKNITLHKTGDQYNIVKTDYQNTIAERYATEHMNNLQYY